MKSREDNSCEFFTDGRIAASMQNADDEIVLLYGGSSAMKDYGDTYCMKVEDLSNDQNFSEITAVF